MWYILGYRIYNKTLYNIIKLKNIIYYNIIKYKSTYYILDYIK